ncbi:MAG: SPL family radical SAM protein [Bullifex sp.]
MNAYDALLSSFSEAKRSAFTSLFEKYSVTQADRLQLLKDSADLELFQEKELMEVLDFESIDSKQGKRRSEELMRQVRAYMHDLRYAPTDYSSFNPPVIKRKKDCIEEITSSSMKLWGKCPCPVDGEKTRCCRLTTLDAAMQCSFGCSYCSVQSFYSENRIKVVKDLGERLESADLDGIWHIGTGQASDSLLTGDRYGTLSALARFAEKHPDTVIELKSKSGRTDVFNRKYPPNMIFTWSLNAEEMIKKEEHLTASLEERINAAKKASLNGSLIGFHIHPMIYHKGWEEGYRKVVSMITENFTPSDICMISFGTLTFTKAVLQHLRTHRTPSRVLEIPLEEAAGKYSYSIDIKEEMFRTAFSFFPSEFRENVFFYLCMEDPSLWKKCLGREYSCDSEFEADMKAHYLKKIRDFVS